MFKNWMNSDMIIPAKRINDSLSLNTTIKNEELYYIITINYNLIDFGIFKKYYQKLNGIPINLTLNSYLIEIYENKFNCQSNLLDP